MTSTNIHVGLTENNRSSSKVLKPPGGGSSDIFGSQPISTPRGNARNHMASNIFTHDPNVKNEFSGENRHSKFNSHNRLFGEAVRPFTPAKNHMKSNIPIGASPATDSIDAAPKTNGHVSNGNVEKVNGESVNMNGNGVSKNELDVSPRSHISSSSQRSVNELASPMSDGISMDSSMHNIDKPIEHSNEKTNLLAISNEITKNDSTTININTTTSSITSSSISPLTDDSSHIDSIIVKSPKMMARNPVTGCGIEEKCRKPRKMDTHRGGNPVTGEGYKTTSSEINTTVPALNGAKQVINKNRVPPGGFSSGLW